MLAESCTGSPSRANASTTGVGFMRWLTASMVMNRAATVLIARPAHRPPFETGLTNVVACMEISVCLVGRTLLAMDQPDFALTVAGHIQEPLRPLNCLFLGLHLKERKAA